MKKLIWVVTLVVFLTGSMVYGGKYEEAIPLIEAMAKGLETFVKDMEKAETADAVAAGLDKYSEFMKKLAPKMNKLMETYPELKDEKTHPEELKPLLKKFDELGKKLIAVFGKIGKFKDDPKVAEANKRWMKVMESVK
jgi:hypothetical protein